MSRKARRIAALAATVAAVGGTSVAATTASAITVPFNFENWAVWGSLTPKKLNAPVVLPKGSTFNGTSELTSTETTVSGTVTGTIFVPPFNATVKVLGIPTNVGVTFTQVGQAEGTIVEAPPANCTDKRFGGSCVTLSVDTRANLGITAVGILGIGVPTHCETTEPVAFALSATLSLGQQLAEGPKFTGTTTIPSIDCGLTGILLSPVLTALMSGPDNPYLLHIGPHEPAPPTITSEEASSVSQISAKLHAKVDPNGEEMSDCHFEYGTSTSYGASVPCSSRPGSGFAVYAQLAGLSEGAAYHFRTVATNALGTSYGPDQTLATLPSSEAPQYGQCVPLKHGNYTDANCTTVAEKKGIPVEHAGSYEFKIGPAPSCVAQTKGEYTDSSCTAKSAKAKKGAYEKAPGPGYGATTGTVTLETPGLGRTVVCSASTASGEVTGLSTGLERVTLTGCEASGRKCTSEGPDSTPSGKAGAIVTNLLHTRLLGPVSGQVWTDLASSEHEPYSAEFGCEGPRFRTIGSLAGVQAGDIDVSSLTSTTSFSVEGGEQALSTELSEDGGKSWSGPYPSNEIAVATNASASSTEIRP